MKIPTFAWANGKFRQAKAWLEATQAWQTMRSLSRAARDYVAHLKGTIAHRFAVFDGQGNASAISKPPRAV
jgi:hypothetical protein